MLSNSMKGKMGKQRVENAGYKSAEHRLQRIRVRWYQPINPPPAVLSADTAEPPLPLPSSHGRSALPYARPPSLFIPL
jgi:hypothetical protein